MAGGFGLEMKAEPGAARPRWWLVPPADSRGEECPRGKRGRQDAQPEFLQILREPRFQSARCEGDLHRAQLESGSGGLVFDELFGQGELEERSAEFRPVLIPKGQGQAASGSVGFGKSIGGKGQDAVRIVLEAGREDARHTALAPRIVFVQTIGEQLNGFKPT